MSSYVARFTYARELREQLEQANSAEDKNAMTEPTTPQLTEDAVREIEAKVQSSAQMQWEYAAPFISHARIDIPALIRDWRAMRARIEQLAQEQREGEACENSDEQQVAIEGITGYWVPAAAGERCSVCFAKERVLRLVFGKDTAHVCEPCGIALRELLIDALEDFDEQ